MRYTPPTIADYGDLLDITADAGALAHVGITSFAAASTPGMGGGTGGASTGSGDVAGLTTGGDPTGSSDGSAGDAAGAADSGGGGTTGTTSGGGAGGTLPFTGLPLAILGAAGAALSAAGVKARRQLARKP